MEQLEEIELQEPQQQPDPPTKKRALYDAVSKKYNLGTYEEYETKLKDPTKRKALYDFIGKEYELGTYQDFEAKVTDQTVKKKSSLDFSGSSLEAGNALSQSGGVDGEQIPTIEMYTAPNGEMVEANPIALSKKYNELSTKTKEIEGLGDRGTMKVVDDEDARKSAAKLKEDFKDIDLGGIYEETKDIPDDVLANVGKELMADREQNYPLYQRKLANIKWRHGLEQQILADVDNGNITPENYNRIKDGIEMLPTFTGSGDYSNQRGAIQSLAKDIQLYGGANKQQILQDFAVEVSKVYGSAYKNNFDKYAADTPESKYLNNDEQLALQYLKDIAPEQAAQYDRLMVDPKLVKDDPDALKGYNRLKQTLEETGIGLQLNSVKEELNNLNNIADRDGVLTDEQISKAVELEKKYGELTQKLNELDKKYPERIEDKVDDALQEIRGQKIAGLNYFGGTAYRSIKNTGQGIWEAVSTPFMSDASNTFRELYIMGEGIEQNNLYHKTDKNTAILTSEMVIEPELQKQIDAITNNKVMSESEKDMKVYRLLKDNTDKFGRVPVKGGKFNINPSSIMYGLSDLGTMLLPFVALETVTGGGATAGLARKFISTFTAAAATTFHAEYESALLSGVSQSDAYKEAMGMTAISSLAMAGAGTPAKIKAMVNPKTSAGQLILSMSDDAIQKVLDKGTPVGLKIFKQRMIPVREIKQFGRQIVDGVSDRLKATPAMLGQGAKTGAEFEVAMTAANEAKHQIYDTEIDREANFKNSLLMIGNFSGLGLMGQARFKTPTQMQKGAGLMFGAKPKEYIAVAEQMRKDGQLNESEFNQRVELINQFGDAYKSVPKDLPENRKAEYLYQTVIKNEANKGKSDLPPKQAAQAEHTALVADYTREMILEPPTDKQLESRKNTLEKQMEAKDAEGKLLLDEKEQAKVKAQLEAVNNESETRKSFEKVEMKKREFVDTKLSEPVEGLNEQGIPTGKDVPPPTEQSGKDAIEKRRQEELDKAKGFGNEKELVERINAKYDSELSALEKQQSGKDVVVDEGVGKDKDVEVYSEPKRYNSEIKVGQKYYDNRYGDFYTIEKMTPVEGGDVDVTLKYDKGKTRTESGNFLLYHIDAKQHSLSKEQPIVSETQKQEKTDDYYIYDFENKEFVKTDNAKPVKLDTDGDFFAVKGDNGYYTIYEGTSGQGIGQSGKLLRDAIKNANESIERNSKAGFPLEMAISGGIKRNGQSPRVKAKNENKSNNEISQVGSPKTEAAETPKPQQQSLSTKPEIKNEEAKATKVPDTETKGSDTAPTISEVIPETKSGKEGKEPPPAEPTDTVGEGGKEPPIDTDAGVYTEDKRTELSFRGLQEVATEFGLDDVSSRERKSDLKLFKDAETEIKKWVDEGSYQKNIETVIKDAAERKPISDTQRVILENHIHAERVKANEIAKQKGVNSKEFKDAVNEIDRVTKAAITSRQEAGAALRIPTTANNNTASLADAIIATKESKSVSELTDAETAEVQKQYKAIEDSNAKFQEYKAEAEAKFKEYQAKIEMLEAGKSTPKGKKTSTDLKTEREEIKKSIIEKWNKAKNVGIVNNPKEDLLIQLAPDIAKLMRNYYQDGVRQLGEMVDKIHTYLKDLGVGVEASDVQDMIAGKYNQKKLTKNEMVAEIKGLQDEAKALNELKSLMNKEPRNEKEKRKKNERLAEIRKQINALKKEQGLDQYSDQAKVDRAIAANKAKEEKYKEKLKKGEFEKQPKHKTIYEAKEWQRQNPSLYKKLLDSQAKADQARADFEAGLIENEMKNAGLGDKFRVVVKKSSGTLKQLFASFDLSAIAVQNLPFILTQPKTSAKGLPKSFVHMVSPKQFDRMITELHNSPDWQIIKDSGLRVTEPKSLLEATREDYFPDRFKAVVKINGKEYGWVNIGGHKYELLDLSKPFERQFTSLGNLLRVVKFRTEAEILKRKGITFENSPEEYKTLAKRLNNLTSSSDIPAAYQNEITRTLIWSSRLVAAKLNMLGISDVAALIPGTGVKKGYYRGLGVKGQKISRQQAMAVYDLAKFATSVVALTYLVALIKGGTVNTNPTSNQFMDVEYDDGKSMNLTGGFSPYIAKLFQFANWGKTDKYGVFKPYKGTDPIKESVTFMSSKAPPVTRSAENIVAGKDQFGQEADVSTEASKYKMPLAIGQIYDQIQKDGVGALFTEGLPTLIGFNAKDNRNYNTHKFSNDTEKFIVENQVPISMPQKVYTKNGEKMEMTEDEYKDFLNQVDKEIDKITSDIKKNGGYVIRNNDVVQLSYPQLTKDEISEMTKEMITEATAKIRKEKFKTDEETDEYIEKSALEELLRETRKAEKDN